MMEFKQISIEEVRPCVEFSYLGDSELLEEFHVKKFDTIEEAVEATMKEMEDIVEVYPQTKFYKVIFNEHEIGYVCYFDECIFSFAINKGYRNKSILKMFWEVVESLIGDTYWCGLYKNNTRCIEFLKKQGMAEAVVQEDENAIILFK